MFDNVIVGVDEHQGGRDAIALAKIIAARHANLVLAHVYPIVPARGGAALTAAEARDSGHELLTAARSEAQVEAKLCCYGSPSVGRGLHEIAADNGADLIVVGSTRRGFFGRVLLGDDTSAALNGAPCAVAIAPTGYARQPTAITEIGVGYDGSTESQHALGAARALASEHGAKLSAFEAVAFPVYGYPASVVIADTDLEQIVREVRDELAALGGVEPHAAYGVPAEELAIYSASLDLLIIGSRSYGPIGRLIHGSTAHQLARMARSPLLILTRTGRAVDPQAHNGHVATGATPSTR
jgi:nucleotide-binding universal stress UspA family protein